MERKTKYLENVSCFNGVRKWEAKRAAFLVFGEDAFFKIEVDLENRKYIIFLREDKVTNKVEGLKRLKESYPQCEIEFVKTTRPKIG